MRIALMPTVFVNRTDESAHLTTILQAKELIKKGHEVKIISDGLKGFKNKEKFQGIDIIRGPKVSRFLTINKILSPALAYKRLIKVENKDFDIIHSFSSARFFVLRTWLAKILSRSKAKTIHSIRGYSYYKLGNSLSKLLNLSNLTTTTSNKLNKELKQKGVKNSIKLDSFIDLSKFKPKDKIKSKKKLGINKNTILYYGNNAKNKGPQFLGKITEKLLTKYPDWKLIMVIRWGKGITKKEYTKAIKEFNIHDNMTFIGKSIDNVEDYVNAADIVALPYNSLLGVEGTPSCIFEAMASNTPIITTDFPEIREVLNEKNAKIVKNRTEFAKELEQLMKNKKLRKRLAKRALIDSKKYGIKVVIKDIIKIYEKLISA